MKNNTTFQYRFDNLAEAAFYKLDPSLKDIISEGKSWIHLTAPSNWTKNKLKKLYSAPSFVWESIFAEETRPRSVAVGDGLLLILRGINLNPGADPDDMVSLRMWVTKDYLISVSRQKVKAVTDACMYITEQQAEIVSSMDCFQLLIDCVFEHIGDAVYTIETELDDLEENTRAYSEEEVQDIIVRLRQQIISYRRYLLPQRDAILKISLDKFDWVDKAQYNYMRDLAENMTRHVEDINTTRERASVFQDSITNKLAERANTKIYVLSVVTLIFMPPMFITGWFGMNIVVPGQTSPITFWVVSGVMTALTGWLFYYFKKNKWM